MQNNLETSPFNLDDFSKKSEEYYREISTTLEQKYKGKYAVVDFENKKYWIGETASEALVKGKAEFPDRLFFLVQIGSPSAFSIQSLHTSRVKNYDDIRRQH